MTQATLLKAETLIDPQVQSTFHIEYSIKHTTPLHYHDYYEIFIITEGRCVHHINGEAQVLEPNTMVFIRPDDMHWYDFYEEADCQFINVNFYKEVVEDAFHYFENSVFAGQLKGLKMPPYVVLPSFDMEMLVQKSKLIHLYTSIDKQRARILARSFLADALTYFFFNDQDQHQKALPQWLNTLLMDMQKKENFTGGLSRLNEISDHSVGHINRVFKQYLHTTPTAYINQLRLGYAKNLLLTTNLTILEISYEAGFDNLSHFYHLFKIHYGASPGKIRSR
ncbi:AraC family transcriptional regulator [Bacillus sp. FJAT-27264]|uniref:helix-turn-helix domain-containing protein n=1 Tax=Paenibacillus sp. (strain DSM 101736 / FJAT-27264) TaxID=1850362 RepID=UPI000807EF1E|nr:helix-turn-helix domain-containing protein [Bacillus sp. FJAT-27264]OBZ14711.1 AraC family transcriptional regulator [Bacillus sp. FJAT-27264]